jgi:hypothetical protein
MTKHVADRWQAFSLLITGYSVSESSEFIKAVNTHFFSDRVSRIVPEDYLVMNLLIVPGVWRFNPGWDEMWKITIESMLGFVLIVDSTQPETFNEAKSLMEHFSIDDHPYIVAANKEDQSGAWPIEDLRIILDVPNDRAVVPCDVSNKGSVKNVLLRLMYKVLDEIALPDQSESEIR